MNDDEIAFPKQKYERSLFVKCNCETIEELPTDETEPIRITGRPKNIAEGFCSRCGKKIVVYVSIWIH